MKKLKTIILIFGLLLTVSFVVDSCRKEDNNNSCPDPCPTTSACGCSAYNKSDCEANTCCCKWTTGQGCGCK